MLKVMVQTDFIEKGWVTYDVAAESLGVNRAAIIRLANEHGLKKGKQGRKTTVSIKDLQRFIQPGRK